MSTEQAPKPMPAQRMLHLNLFIFACGHHRAAWRHPTSPVERLGAIRYFEGLARTAARGKLAAIFFADAQWAEHVAAGPRCFLEPLPALSALSSSPRDITPYIQDYP